MGVYGRKCCVRLAFFFENVRDEKLDLEDVKPKLVARFGKILLHESPSISEETTRVGLAAETTLSQLRRSFYTNIPNSDMENIKGEVAQKIKVDIEEEKDLYHVQLSDATLPDSTISCKCSVIKEDKRLQLCKIELHPLRHMVIDISCLDKNLDLRLMLSTKRTLTALNVSFMSTFAVIYVILHYFTKRLVIFIPKSFQINSPKENYTRRNLYAGAFMRLNPPFLEEKICGIIFNCYAWMRVSSGKKLTNIHLSFQQKVSSRRT